MDFSASTWWWILAGILVAVEMVTGTIYLLALGLGAAAGAIAAHLGAGVTAQIVTAAIVGGGAVAAWHYKRATHPRSAPAEGNRDVNLDIGETVRVEAWGTDGQARVNYRGTQWSVRYAGPGTAQPGDHVVVAVRGNRLDVAPAPAR
jgi:membrane protein implicated in regulation of membrane protease activity